MPDQIIAGIDIGTSKIATLISKTTDEASDLRIMGFASVPSRGVKRGQIVDINQVTAQVEESVEKAERMAGLKINSSIVSIGGPHIGSLNSHGVVAVSRPDSEITADDVTRAVEAAKAISLSSAREVVEVIPREYMVDGSGGIKNPVGMSGVRLEVNTHIITAATTNLKNIERSLGDLGIGVDGYVFSGLASALSVLSDTDKELGVALVDIGGGKTDLCIYVEGALSHSISLPLGARHITNDIAVGLRISLESAEKIKLFLMGKKNVRRPAGKGVAVSDEIDVSSLQIAEGLTSVSYKTVVDGIIKPRLEELFEKIYDEIDRSEYSAQIPSGLVITGGGAQTVSAVESAKRMTGLSTRIGVPSGVTGLIDEIVYPNYATVVGLLLYGREHKEDQQKMNMKDFNQILKNFSVSDSMKQVTKFIKTLIP